LLARKKKLLRRPSNINGMPPPLPPPMLARKTKLLRRLSNINGMPPPMLARKTKLLRRLSHINVLSTKHHPRTNAATRLIGTWPKTIQARKNITKQPIHRWTKRTPPLLLRLPNINGMPPPLLARKKKRLRRLSNINVLPPH
jgi:hypothetical protein